MGGERHTDNIEVMIRDEDKHQCLLYGENKVKVNLGKS